MCISSFQVFDVHVYFTLSTQNEYSKLLKINLKHFVFFRKDLSLTDCWTCRFRIMLLIQSEIIGHLNQYFEVFLRGFNWKKIKIREPTKGGPMSVQKRGPINQILFGTEMTPWKRQLCTRAFTLMKTFSRS